MNCYRHQQIVAVGTCKNCSKGLCPDCLTEVDNSLACTDTCVEEVKTLNALINRNKKMIKSTTSSYYRNAFIYGAIGLVFIYSAFLYPDLRFYMYPASAVFLIGAISLLYGASKIRKA